MVDCWRNEGLQKRRDYLIHSLFEKIPRLSPVVEEDENIYSDGRSIHSDLIIEKAPNYHDEPEEFYKNLEIRIRKAYRRIFFGEKSSDQESLDNDSVTLLLQQNSTLLVDNNEIDIGHAVKNTKTNVTNVENTLKTTLAYMTVADDTHESSEETSDFNTNEIIITQADVHREAKSSDYCIYGSNEKSVQEDEENDNQEGLNSNDNYAYDQKDINNNNENINQQSLSRIRSDDDYLKSQNNSNYSNVEIMRGNRLFTSFEVSNSLRCQIESSPSSPRYQKEVERDFELESDTEIVVAQCSTPNQEEFIDNNEILLGNSSTPKRHYPKMQKSCFSSKNTTRKIPRFVAEKHKIASEAPYITKKKKPQHVDVAVQTCQDMIENDKARDMIINNYLLAKKLLRFLSSNLCRTCKNHKCV